MILLMRFTSGCPQVLSTPYFYFSYTLDITHTRQRLDSLRFCFVEIMKPFNKWLCRSAEFASQSLLERSEKRFVWNLSLLQPLMANQSLHRYALPVIHGFVSINPATIAGTRIVWTLVSRRSTQRVGTRLFVRGGDVDGHVANFVETEQLVEVGGSTASFVQTRGSIPLHWQQRPDLRYKPPPSLESGVGEHRQCFSRHMEEQVRLYGHQVMVNLVDQKGAEGRLEARLRAVAREVNNANVTYEAFDFHAECSKMRWDRLSILMDRVAVVQEQQGFFLQEREGSFLMRQTGVFRTNCIDCLDRTNVVQSMLARRNLQAVLRRLSVLQEHMKVEDQTVFEGLFKNVWADHADMVSIQYTGTGALKTDFTRTGKRTKMGLLEDGRRSLIRYYKNNFADGFRQVSVSVSSHLPPIVHAINQSNQDSLDLFVGNHTVSPTEGVTHESPLAPLQPDQRYLNHLSHMSTHPSPTLSPKNTNTRYMAAPLALLLCLAMLTLSLAVPAELTTEILLSVLFWAGQGHGLKMNIERGCEIFSLSYDWRDHLHNEEEWTRLCGPAKVYFHP